MPCGRRQLSLTGTGTAWVLAGILHADDLEVARHAQSDLASSDGGPFFGAGKNLSTSSFWTGLIDDVRIYDRAIKP